MESQLADTLKSSHLQYCTHFILSQMHLHMCTMNSWMQKLLQSVKQTGSPVPIVPELYNNLSTAFVNLCAGFGRLKDWAFCVTHHANISQPHTAMERSENVASLCSPERIHITMPTGSIPEAPEIRIPPYYRHTAVAPMVSTLEGPHCIWYMKCKYHAVNSEHQLAAC